MIDKEKALAKVEHYIKGTMLEHLNISFTDAGEDYLVAKMPVDERTYQPMRILHGGASLALAETVGSAASNLIVDTDNKVCLGLELNANHVRSVKEGWVYARASAIHIGRKTHIWDIRITDEQDKLVSIARLTNIVLDK